MRRQVEIRAEATPLSPFRLPRGGMDGVVRRRGTVLERLLHVGGEPVVLRAAQPAADRVVMGAWAATRTAAETGLARLRFALGVDDDLRPFLRAFRDDPWIGASIRRAPWLRPPRRADAFEALVWAICEQLIEIERATAIERRIVFKLGRRCADTGLRDLPDPATLAGIAPARLQSFDLALSRAIALRRCAHEVATGRVDLHAPGHEAGWARLRRIPGIGQWTIDMLAQQGQGRHDVFPAGDLGFLKLIGRRLSGGDPYARATEEQVRDAFAPYGAWVGPAAAHALRAGGLKSAARPIEAAAA
jgi:3-methyladenine DNA glycosylase/8-oxoguanine DNA glycosylase